MENPSALEVGLGITDGDHSPWHNLMGTHPFIPTWASAREQHRKQIERRDEEQRCAEALLQEKKRRDEEQRLLEVIRLLRRLRCSSRIVPAALRKVIQGGWI